MIEFKSWFGVLPPTWRTPRLSHVFGLISSGTTPDTNTQSYYGGDIPWVTTSELRETTINTTQKTISGKALTDLPTLKLYPPNTLLIAMYGATIGRIGILGVPATTNQACCALAAPRGITPRFAYYTLLAARDHILSLATGGGQPNVNQELIRSLRIPLPPIEVQQKIAELLDAATATIDALTAKKQLILALLEARRDALAASLFKNVTQASFVRLKFVCDILPGFAFPSGQFNPNGSGVRLLRGINVAPGRIDWSELESISPDSPREFERFQLQKDDIVVGMDRPWIGGGLRVALIRDQDIPSLLVQRVARLRCHAELLPAFAEMCLRSPQFLAHFGPDMTGVSVPHISDRQIGDFRIPVPSMSEQKAIVAKIGLELTKTDHLAELIETAIDALRARRVSLIKSAVTGQPSIPTIPIERAA